MTGAGSGAGTGSRAGAVTGGLGGALRGVRVLDLSRLLPGPFASLVLADLGASVDKVEERDGDYVRHMPPLVSGPRGAGSVPSDQSAYFLALNRGKRSIALDLKKKSAVAALLRMLPHYDVLLEQFRPGVLARLGLSHDELRANNPRLIVCALTGYGQDGPLAGRAGHDIDYLARAGVLGQQGPAGGPPQVPGFQLADVAGALWSVIGILAALAQREETGEGATVDISMTEASMGFSILGLAAQLAHGTSLTRGDEPLTGGLAAYGVYTTKDDRAVALGALEPKFWMAFAAAVGLPDDASGMVPGPHQRELKEQVKAIFASRTRDEWEAFSREHDVCLEPVLDPSELMKDPQHAARQVFMDVDSPWGILRQLRLPVTPKGAAPASPPTVGQHTDEILRAAGLGDAEIGALRAEGAVA